MQSHFKNVFVTGASGFIGAKVVSALQRRGIQVTAATRDANRRSPDCVPALVGLQDYDAIAEFVARNDAVIHLAGMVGVNVCNDNIAGAIHDNVLGTLNLLDAMRSHRKPGVFVGVGNASDSSAYAITKSTAERFVHMYNKEHGTSVLPLRVFNVYGPGQRAASGKLIVNSIAKGLKGEELTVFGDGEQLNDFILVDDAAELIVASLDRVFSPMPQHALHVGTGVATSVTELVELIRRETGGTSEIVRKPARPGEVLSRVVADPEFMWLPSGMKLTGLTDGIRETIRHMRHSIQ